SLIASEPGDGIDRILATRGDRYALIYTPMGKAFRVQLGRISGETVRASWFDPRTGESQSLGTFPNRGQREFQPPGEPAVGNDWELVFDASLGSSTD
ncbi:MAG TPA: putative collagen-binding domain-containing protein, partial [Thermoguttaceae bacterium]|nr:putative collagen-binding domain-containing protein [Thermoguttaceae bacterium]